MPFKEQKPLWYKYIFVSQLQTAAKPSEVKGFADSNSFLTVPAPCSAGQQGNTGAEVLVCPDSVCSCHSECEAYIPSSWHLCFRTVFTDQKAAMQINQHTPSAGPRHGETRVGCSSPPACGPRDTSHQNYNVDQCPANKDISPCRVSYIGGVSSWLFQTQPQRELRAMSTRPCPSP